MLQEANKQVRVGITRTDIDAITAELYEQGITKPQPKNWLSHLKPSRSGFVCERKFGDALTFTGPDCGLGGWPTQEAAQLVLEQTVKAVKQTTA